MSTLEQIDDTVFSYATQRQIEIVDCLKKHEGCKSAAARELGIKRQSITSILKSMVDKAVKRGYSPKHNMKHAVPDGYVVKGTSTLYDADGQAKIQWVKSSIDQERQREMHQTLAAADAYSSRGGYISERATTCITYSKKHGEVSRISVKPSMLEI